MSTSSLPVLWICGPPGSGKSSAAWSPFERVAGEGVAVAYLDIDQLGMLYPESADDPDRFRLKTEALNALIPNYLASGARALIMSGVVDLEAPADLAERYPNAQLRFCLLKTAEATLRQRILARGWDPEDADHVVADAATVAKAGFLDASIDTTGASIEEVVERVRPLLSTIASSVPDAAQTLTPSAEQAGLIVLTGARAVGTSTVGFELARSQWDSGVTTGFADLDHLAFLRTGDADLRAERALGVANVAALHELFLRHGAARVIVSSHLGGTLQHDVVRMAAPGALVRVVRLRADDETIAGHVRQRTSGSGARLAGDDLAGASPTRQVDVIQQARSLQEMLDAGADEDILIDVSRRSIDSVIQEIADVVLSVDLPGQTSGPQPPGEVIFQHPLAY